MKTVDEFLSDINDDIEVKCAELKRKKKEKRLNILFLICCCLIFIAPVIMTVCGMSILNILLTFLAAGAFILGAFAITKTLGGAKYDQTVRYEL